MRPWLLALLLGPLLLAAGPAGAQACGDGTSSYTITSPLDEVPEAAGRELEIVVARSGDSSCAAVANIRLLEADLDFTGPLTFKVPLAAGVARASVFVDVLDDKEPEPAEEFEIVGDLQVTSSDGTKWDYPGHLHGRVRLQASDAYDAGLGPRIAFQDESRTNRTTMPENASWYPKFTVSFAPLEDTVVTLLLDNGTCAECRVFTSRFVVKAGQRTVTLPASRSPEVWAPDDNRSEPPEAACLRISAPGMRSGAPRALVIIDDENVTRAPLTNRTLLLRTGLTNATIDHLQDPCGKPLRPPRTTSVSPPRTTQGASTSALRNDGPGVPSDSPLLQEQQKSPPAGLALLAVALLLAARGRRRP